MDHGVSFRVEVDARLVALLSFCCGKGSGHSGLVLPDQELTRKDASLSSGLHVYPNHKEDKDASETGSCVVVRIQ